jgi:hypothetical protein
VTAERADGRSSFVADRVVSERLLLGLLAGQEEKPRGDAQEVRIKGFGSPTDEFRGAAWSYR